MNIIKVIVDELPKSVLECDFAIHEWEHALGEVLVTCELTNEQGSMDKLSFITRLCLDCPLREVMNEFPEVQE